MRLNDYRDEVKEFLVNIKALGKNQGKKVEWLQEELNLLKLAIERSDEKRISHQIYDMMHLLFEMAAENNCDLDSEWLEGEKRKDKYIN